MKNCTPLWREAHFQVKMYKTLQLRSTFRSWAVEKVHAVVARSTFQKSKCTKHTSSGPLWEVELSKKGTSVVARSTFRSQNAQSTPAPDHFWKLRCRKSALRCGAKHISKSTCTKHTRFGPSCDVEKVHVVVARSTFRSQNVQSTTCSRQFWRFRSRFAWQAQGIVHLLKSEQNVRVL